MMLNCIAVDDEPLALSLVCRFIEQTPFLHLAGQYPSAVDALKAIHSQKIDLIYLDIQMPDLSGMELAKVIGTGPETPRIIFTTAFAQFGIEGYKVDALDYLLKPFDAARFSEALSRARLRIQAAEALPVEALVADARPRQAAVERVLIRDGSQVHVIPVDRIDYVEAQDDYVCFKADGKDYLKDQTMAVVESTLDPMRFVRVHRSWIVNTAHVCGLRTSAFVMDDDSLVPIGRMYRDAVRQRFVSS
jgi:DNA-binding LytR/AlgR family response regulator